MIIARYTAPHLVLVAYTALILVFVNPVTPHPVRTPQWARSGDLKDLEIRGVWKSSEREEKSRGFQLSQVEHILPPTQMKAYHDKISPERSTPERLSQRAPSSDESIVSILVPVAPASAYLPHRHDHPTTSKQDDIVPQRLHHYGELFDNQEKDLDGLIEPETEPYTSSTLQISHTHYISFSYRISFPFLKYAPKCLPRFPLPGIFTTVVLLLALVWIAILTIALVELGNYMWKKRRAAMLALESDNTIGGGIASSCEEGKIPLEALLDTGPERSQSCVDNASLMSDSNSASGSDSEPEVDDYRIF